jgi:hypothetical protein
MKAERAQTIRARLCIGLGPVEIFNLICAAIRPEHHPIMEAIWMQLPDYETRGRKGPDGLPAVHGFVDWIWGLEDGRWSLPEELPGTWLVAWRDGYKREWGGDKEPWCPHPFQRCEGCRLALPNVGPTGSLEDEFTSCPACRSTTISSVCFFDMRKFSLDGGVTTFF